MTKHRYEVTLFLTASMDVEVFANDKEEAVTKAYANAEPPFWDLDGYEVVRIDEDDVED